MEFTCDARSFGIDLLLGDQGLLAFGSFGSFGETVGPFATPTQVVAQHERRDEDDRAADEVADVDLADREPGDEQQQDADPDCPQCVGAALSGTVCSE